MLPSKFLDFDILFYKNFVLYSILLSYAVGVESKIFGNRVMSFLSGISLEIYLSHMFVFRFIEKLHLQYLFGDTNRFSYIFCVFFTLAGVFVLIFCYKWAMRFFQVFVIRKLFMRLKSYEQ